MSLPGEAGSMDTTAPVAVIDCGTNSVRLLVGDLDPATGRLRTFERLMRITRLGQGVSARGSLDPEAVERTLTVLREYREVMDRFAVGRVRATATSAARDADNADGFFDAAEKVLGVRPEVISGEEEAALSFVGATSDLDPAEGPFLIVDIGGGSTELAYGTDRLEAAISVDIGCVRMTEQFLSADPPKPDELSACLSVVEAYLDDVRLALADIDQARTFVGLAGTITTVAAVEIGLATYDRDRIHHYRLTKPAVEEVFRTLATESIGERIENPGLEPERADVIVGGMCVLVQIMRTFGLGSCLVSEADILDGLALGLLR
jgi:exopolyphosphatase/guanosine-5'-triphosphate,3'-diphosphate pyrophosphatase